jgi:CBS domain-containing protein
MSGSMREGALLGGVRRIFRAMRPDVNPNGPWLFAKSGSSRPARAFPTQNYFEKTWVFCFFKIEVLYNCSGFVDMLSVSAHGKPPKPSNLRKFSNLPYMLTVKQLLAGKKINQVYSVRPDHTVYEALELMSSKNIGAVLVMNGEQLAGIFSERDYARKGIVQGRKAKSTPVTEVMTANVFTVLPTETIQDCMKIMSEKHFRHLPVVEGGQVLGVLSISDIVTAIITEQASHIQNLEQYITGGYG